MPGLSPESVELIDSVEDGKRGFSHLLVYDGSNHYHLWSMDGRTPMVDNLNEGELLRILRLQAETFRTSERLETSAGSELIYQRFGPWVGSTLGPLSEADVRTELVRENGDLRVRCETPSGRFMMDLRKSDLKPPIGDLMLSRLNSRGFRHSPTLLGVSLWYDGSTPLSWMRLVQSGRSGGSGFRPFLSDLKTIMVTSSNMPARDLQVYLIRLSRSRDAPSLKAAAAFGEVIGELHGSVMFEENVHTSERTGVTSSMVELFNPGEFSTGDAGAILGLSSFYLTELRKEFTKLLGDKQRVNPMSGRKMKALKQTRVRMEGVDLLGLDLIRDTFLKKEELLRSRFARLRGFAGSPLVPACLDPRLDRVETDPDGGFMIEHFDWKPFGAETVEMSRTLPLKDLAMVLNSLAKARYLVSRQMIREACSRTRVDERQMMTLFLEYSMSKGDYNQIMRDFGLFSTISGRNVPFRHVFTIAVVGALWFQLVRNSFIGGYTSKLQKMGKDELLAYPKGIDTVQGVDTFRSMLGLGTSLELLKQGRVASAIGLEAELMNVICMSDQA
ncbi:MAG: hypothetical protein ACMUFK_01745 [Thermoplasmatota archaeon]